MQRQVQPDAAAAAAAHGEDERLTGGVRLTMGFVLAEKGHCSEELLLATE